MNKIEEYNYNLVKNDIENIYKIFKDLLKEKDINTLILGWFQYFILICIEASNYVDIKNNFKYKKAIENCRARMKPLEIEYEKIYYNMEELNYKKMNEFKSYVKRGVREILKSIIPNYGVYKINNKIIGNTFLYESIYKKIIYENGQINTNKMVEVSKEIGSNISILINVFDINRHYDGIDRNISIINKDYNVFKCSNGLFKKCIDTNDGLILLNSISIINFYTNIICEMVTSKELKYRLGYIVYENTYNNILKSLEKIPNEKISKIMKKYECLKNEKFRNCMFHYSILYDLNESELKEEMFLGIISKYLSINEETYIKLINKYMIEIAEILEKDILK